MSHGHELPPPGCLHVWMAHDQQIVDPALLRCYATWISPQEAERMNRFVFARHRHQYLVTRALLRSTLSFYAPGVAPADWRFSVNAWGKPSIVGSPLPMAFNLSHTEGLIVLAVTSGSQVGVDIERQERPIDLGLAERFFSRLEAEQLFCLPTAEKPRRFFDLWTLKEAYIKACGQGMSIALDSFSFVLDETDRIDFIGDRKGVEDGRWQFCQFEVEGYTLALCCETRPAGGPPDIRAFEVTPPERSRPVDIVLKRCSTPMGFDHHPSPAE